MEASRVLSCSLPLWGVKLWLNASKPERDAKINHIFFVWQALFQRCTFLLPRCLIWETHLCKFKCLYTQPTVPFAGYISIILSLSCVCVCPDKVLQVRNGCFSFSDLQKSGFQNWCITHIPFPQTHVSLCRGSGWLKCCQLYASLVTKSPSSGSLETHFKSSFSAAPLPQNPFMGQFLWEFWMSEYLCRWSYLINK